MESRLPPAFRHSTDNAVNNMIQRATDSKADDKLSKEFVHPVHLNYKVRTIENNYMTSTLPYSIFLASQTVPG